MLLHVYTKVFTKSICLLCKVELPLEQAGTSVADSVVQYFKFTIINM